MSMHFQVICAVRLQQKLAVADDSKSKKTKSKPSSVSGYSVALGINADSILEAVTMAHAAALGAMASEGDKIVDELEAKKIDKTDWQPEVLRAAHSIDSKGVYFTSSLNFFPAG